jgi:hypothetical protein
MSLGFHCQFEFSSVLSQMLVESQIAFGIRATLPFEKIPMTSLILV